jgi:hypothetical protein
MRGFQIAGGVIAALLGFALASPAPAGITAKANCTTPGVSTQVNTQSTATNIVTQAAPAVTTRTVTTPSTFVRQPDQFVRVPGELVEIPGQTTTYQTSTTASTLSAAATNTLATNTVATDVDVRAQVWRPAKFATWRANRDAKHAQTALLQTTVAAPAEIPRRRRRLLTESVATQQAAVTTQVQSVGCGDLGATD